jgi:hypothetical protein
MQRLPSAADVVNSRQAEDYSAQLNGTADVPLSKRTVTGIHCLSSTDFGRPPNPPNTIGYRYIDISCQSDI